MARPALDLEEAKKWLKEVAAKDTAAKALKEGRLVSGIATYVIDYISASMDKADWVVNKDVGISQR